MHVHAYAMPSSQPKPIYSLIPEKIIADDVYITQKRSGNENCECYCIDRTTVIAQFYGKEVSYCLKFSALG